MGGHDRAVDLLHEQIVAGGLGEEGIGFPEKAALAGQGFDDALAFQLGVGLGNGVAVDAEFLGQRPDGGQGLAITVL